MRINHLIGKKWRVERFFEYDFVILFVKVSRRRWRERVIIYH